MTVPDSSKRSNSSVRKIGIFGHVGTKNLGDEMIIAAVIQNTRRRFPNAEICSYTFRPEDTRLRHKITAFPIRRTDQPASAPEFPAGRAVNAHSKESAGSGIRASLKKIPLLYPLLKRMRDCFRSLAGFYREIEFLTQSYRNLQGTDLLMIAGSGQLTDHSGGPWGYPYTFFKWLLLAKATGTKVAFMSVGTSWVESSMSRFLLRFALSRADYRSYRDENSRKQMMEWGPAGKIIVAPDLAYSFEMPAIAAQPKTSRSARVVGINPIPFFHDTLWHKADKKLYEQYVLTQSNFAAWLIQKGYDVLFFPTQLRADSAVIADIIQTIARCFPGLGGYRTVEPPIRSHEDLLAAMNAMDFVVAARFHGTLISHLLYKPVLAISYHTKTADLMAQMGLSNFALPINDSSLDGLTNKFLLLESQSAAIATELERRVPCRRVALNSQYERVFGLMKQGVTSAHTLDESNVWPKEPSNARIDYGS